MRSLRRMAPFVRPYWVVAFFLVITVILPVAMELLVPRALSFIIDEGIELLTGTPACTCDWGIIGRCGGRTSIGRGLRGVSFLDGR